MEKETDRRTFLRRSAAALAGAPVVLRTATSGSGKRPPNIVFAFSDEHRWQSMSFTELPAVHTPNMSRLAAEGAHFTHCISNYPVCSPYRAILMTGRWPYRQRMRDSSPGMIDNAYALSPDQVTLGHVFRRAGYRTGYIGKWHMGGTRAEPFGFDHSLIWTRTNTHWRSQYHPAGRPAVTAEGYNATLMTDQALAFIDQNRDRPFFLMLSWNPPHSNFLDAPEEMQARYRDAGSLPYRLNVPPDFRAGVGARRAVRRQAVYRGYHAHVSAVDVELGRVLAGLDEWKLTENTVVVYASDHGSMLGSHSVGGKRQPYEESIRVPFLVRWPGHVPAGRRIEALFGAIDIFPTLCALAGMKPPVACDGEDFSGWLAAGGHGPSPGSQLIMHIAKEHASGGRRHPAPLFRGVTTGRWTYALYPDRPWCLFDNRNDPYQLDNRIADPGLSKVRRQLREMLDRWLRKARDPIQLPG